MGSADAKKRKKRSLIWNYILFLGPTILLFTAIEIIPLLMGIGYSFTNWDGIANGAGFIGLKNYIKLFTNALLLVL